MRRLAVVLATLVALVSCAPAFAAAPAAVTYRPPVDAPVVDPFRPPPEDWNSGNRGLEYATVPGTPVTAAAAGQVVFAGQVGGSLHVVVLDVPTQLDDRGRCGQGVTAFPRAGRRVPMRRGVRCRRTGRDSVTSGLAGAS